MAHPLAASAEVTLKFTRQHPLIQNGYEQPGLRPMFQSFLFDTSLMPNNNDLDVPSHFGLKKLGLSAHSYTRTIVALP